MDSSTTATPAAAASGHAMPEDTATTDTSAGGLRSFRRYTYWSVVGAALALLVLPTLTGPVPLPPAPLGVVALVAALVVVAAVMRLTERHIPRTGDAAPPSTRQWRTWAVVGAIAALVVAAASVVAGDEILWAFAPAMIASLLIASLPQQTRRVAAAAAIGVAAVAGIAISAGRGDDPLVAFPLGGAIVTAFVLFLTLVTIWTWNVAVQLDHARRKAATLAVANERLRFAADLHDIQGHNLQVIALKSELAHRLLRADPDAAEREMAAVQQLAAEALRDTRAVVHGYRRATVDTEIANTSNVLASAGIDVVLHVEPDLRADALPETSRHLLGLVLREAVTNILRHSAATRAEVRLTGAKPVRLTVVNDGVDHDATSPAGGLGDLAERLHAVGGALSWRRDGDRFEVQATLPAAPAPEPNAGSAPGRTPEDPT